MEKMTRTADSYKTYAEYVAARRATRHHVLPETLWTALKEDEAAWEVKDVSLRLDPTKPAYIVRTV